jgi:hypothetical protein
VNQEKATAFEPNNEILAAAIDGHDTLAFELGRYLCRVIRTDKTRVVDGDALEAAADEPRLELPPDALDFR